MMLCRVPTISLITPCLLLLVAWELPRSADAAPQYSPAFQQEVGQADEQVPPDVDELLQQALQAGDERHWAQALRILVQAREIGPERPDLHYNLGLVYERLSNPTLATVSYRRALEIEPGLASAANNLAKVLMARRDIEGAEHLLRTALKHSPHDGSLHYHLALLLFQREQRLSESAIKALEEAQARGFEQPHLYLLLGRVARYSGELDEAQLRLKRGLELAPYDPELQHEQGLVQSALGNLDTAIDWLSKAFKRRPEHAKSGSRLAEVLLKAGRPGEAMVVLEEALKQNPEEPDLLYSLARAERDRGDPNAQATMDRYQRLQEVAQEHQNATAQALAEVREGVRLWGKGELHSAAESFEKALSLQPDQLIAKAYLAAAYLELGQKEQAEDLARRIIAVDPENSQALLVLGRLQLRDSPADALRLLQRAVALYPYRVVCLLSLAEAYLQTGQRERSIELIERAASIKPDHPWMLALRRQLVGADR